MEILSKAELRTRLSQQDAPTLLRPVTTCGSPTLITRPTSTFASHVVQIVGKDVTVAMYVGYGNGAFVVAELCEET